MAKQSGFIEKLWIRYTQQILITSFKLLHLFYLLFYSKMFLRYFIFLLVLGLSLTGNAQKNFTISGSVKDGKTGEELIGAVLFIKDVPNVGASTNAYGYYSLTL